MSVEAFLAPPFDTTLPPVIPRPPREPDPWVRTRSVWRGWDGSVWDLTNPDGGVFLKKGQQLRGLGAAKPIHYRQQSPALNGAQWKGLIYDTRSVSWPIRLFHDGSSEGWIQRNLAWWNSFHPRYTGTWMIEHPGLGVTTPRRYLDLRLEDDGDWGADLDPAFFGWADYVMRLLAEQPLWRGDTIYRPWTAGSPEPFAPVGGGPPFTIGSSFTFETATLENTGDEAAPVRWLAVGPSTSTVVGVSGRILEIPFELEEGQGLIVDPSPDAQTAIEATVTYDRSLHRYVAVPTGVERTGELGETDWDGQVVLPHSGQVDLSLEINGTGAIQAEMTPMYLRAM